MNHFLNNMRINLIPSYGEFIKSFLIANGIYGLWIVLHFAGAHFYTEFCTPKSFIGFITSPILVSTPHCTGLRWIINEGANSINAMWVILGTWFVGSFVMIKQPFLNKNIKVENTKIS